MRFYCRLPLFAAACFLLIGFHEARAQLQLTFGVDASDKPSAMVQQIRPTLDLLEQAVGRTLGEKVTINMVVERDYQLGIERLIQGHSDFERLGPASYVEAKDKAPGITIIAAERYGGSHFFEGVICVGAKSGITRIKDLKGKSFAFGDEQSTIGRYLAQLYLARHGIRADDLKSFEYLGHHDSVAYAVASGQFNAGALEGTTFQKLVNQGMPIRQLASFRNVTKPWVARPGLDPRVVAALRKGLLGIHDKAALAALRFDGFLLATDDNYAIIRSAIEENPLFFHKPES